MKILNYEFDNKAICTINYPEDKIRKQRQIGITNIVPVTKENFIKRVYGAAGADYIECILVNGKISDRLAEILTNIYYKNAKSEQWDSSLKKMVKIQDNKEFKHIFYKHEDKWHKFIPDAEITTLDKRKEAKISTQVAVDQHTEEVFKGQRIPEDRKAKMRRFIKYYDLEMPRTEPEWVNTYHQLAFYIRNKINYAFDTNQYEICKECGELVHRGVEHICYCEIPEKRTRMDVLVNGGI